MEWADAVGKMVSLDFLDTKLPQTFSRWKSVVSAKCKRKLQQNEMCLYAASVSTSICTPVSVPAGSFASVYITSPSLHLILRIHPVSMSTQLASAGPSWIYTVWILLISCYCVCYCVTSWLQLGNLLITMGEFYSGAETNKLRVKLDYRRQIMMGDIFLLLPKRNTLNEHSGNRETNSSKSHF